MNKTLEHLKNFMESEEGKKSMDNYVKKLIEEDERRDRNVERFKARYENNLDEVIEKLMDKYYSDEYVTREHKIGYEPREKLLWLVYEYATKYCKPCEDERYFNDFTADAYYIGSYVIQLMIGQGSALIIQNIKD
jgi:hypothetical protein